MFVTVQRDFVVVMDKVMRAVTAGSVRDITWKLTQTLENLDYADDICLLSHKFVHTRTVNPSPPLKIHF
jgi:hypothetical protein